MERGESSSDEDEDRRNLVLQHEHKPPQRSAFEIAGDLTGQVRRKLSAHKKYYIVAVSLPLIIVLIYFFLPLGRLFNGISIVNPSSPSDFMRESELKALYLLRNQQQSLLDLWNKTLAEAQSRSNASAPNLTSVPFDEFRSAVLDQIKMNRQIQKALLSSHRPKNATAASGADDDNVGPDLANYGLDVCKKVEWPANRRTIEWKPKEDRFLFAICISGQMSNHLICLEKHMFFAALLDRVLVFPSEKLDYKYDEVLDLNHINECFGRKVVISYKEFVEMKKNKVKIDKFICYIAKPPCFLDEDHIKRLKDSGISLGKIEAAWPEDAKLKKQKKRFVDDLRPKFSSDDEVIAVGDMFYADVEEEWVMQPGGPLAHKCRALLQPSRLIVLTAQRFVQTFLGSNFIALHFRRHGFLKFWYVFLDIGCL